MGIDLALLQEAGKPPPDVAERIKANPAIEVDSAPWETMIVGGMTSYRTAIVKLSDRFEIDWIEARSIDTAESRDLVASWPGTIAAAFVTPPSGDPLVAVSMYAQWVRTHTRAGSNFLFSDGSVHHVVSDLSTFIAKEDGHRVLAAGDMNILRGYGEYGSGYWAARYKTVFDRMEAMGLPCVGPEYPNGRQALAAGTPARQQECPHLSFQPAIASNGEAPVGLRVRLDGTHQFTGSARPQRAGGMGAERPLPDRDRACGRSVTSPRNATVRGNRP